jgi:hypothetical protein
VSVLGDHADQRRAVQEHGVDLDHEAEDVLAVEVDRPWIGERQRLRRDRLQRRGGVHDERVPARTGEDAGTVPRAAIGVVHAERDRFARREGADSFLLGVARRWREDAVEDQLLVLGGERRRLASLTWGERAQSEAVDEPVGEQVGRLRERERVHHEHELSRPLRAREGVHVGDVGDRVGQRARPRDVIGHAAPSASQSAASSSSGFNAGCCSASAASGWSSTCWKAALTR